MSFWKRVIKKFRFAFRGLGLAFSTDNSFKFHFFFSILVIGLGFFLGLTPREWVYIALSIGFVIVSELFNTAIEYLVRILVKEHHHEAGRLLDISAGAVLFAVLTALVVGLLVLGPKLWTRVAGLFY